MARKKKRKAKKAKRHYLVLIGAVTTIAVIAFLIALIFISHNYIFVPENEIYVSSVNPQQGDTVLVKASGSYAKVNGVFNNKIITFFRNSNYSDWYAFLGIDANMGPGEYKILVNTSGKAIEKEIFVEERDFPSTKMAISQELQDKGYTANKVLTNISQNDNPSLEEVFKKFTSEAYFTGAFSLPLKNVSKSGFDFGEIIKFTGYDVRHFGIDLRAGLDTKVFAVNDGKVVMARDLSNYGKTIIIDHGLGIFSLYLHLDKFRVQEGELVINGQIIALSGDSGYAAGPHLHFSMRDNGSRVDPVAFIEETSELKQNLGLASVAEALSRFLNNFMLK